MNESDPWIVFGRIAGEHLPSQAIKIGAVNLGPMPYAGAPLERSGTVVTSPEPVYSTWHSAEVRVYSHCYFWTPVVTNSARDAIELFAERELPLLRSALSIRSSEPYDIETLWAERSGQREGAPSVAGFNIRLHSELRAAGIARANADYSALDGNETSRQAARDFSDAIVQALTAATRREKASALLTYVQVIERMTRSVPLPSNPELERNQLLVMGALEAELQSSPEVGARAFAIKRAGDELRRLDNEFLNLRVTAMADAFGLGEEWRQGAAAFVRFRHRRLGHAGPPLSAEELRPWYDGKSRTSAYALAATLLATYADSPFGRLNTGHPAIRS